MLINISKNYFILFFLPIPLRGESHDFWEFVYDAGEVFIQAGKNRIRLKQGEIIFHEPDEFHKIECDGEHSANIFILSFECKSRAMRYFSKKIIRVADEPRGIMTSIIDESVRNFEISRLPLSPVENPPVGGQQLIRLYLEMFLIKLMRTGETGKNENTLFTSRQNLEDKLANDIIEYLSAHVYDKVSLEELSRHFHFGTSHLCSVFRKSTNNSIIHYFLELKIEEAKKLLRKMNLSVADVSERLKFESPQYFARIFRRYTGMTPKTYKNTVAVSRTGRAKI